MTKQGLPWKPKPTPLWKPIALVAGAVALIAIVSIVVIGIGGQNKVHTVVRMGRLARLPESFRELKALRTGDSGATTYRLKFAAAPLDIERFLADSPGLHGVTPELFGPQHMHLPDSERPATTTADSANTYFSVDARCPWFNPTVRVEGRRFVIPSDADANHGELIVDDVTHTVYILVTSS